MTTKQTVLGTLAQIHKSCFFCGRTIKNEAKVAGFMKVRLMDSCNNTVEYTMGRELESYQEPQGELVWLPVGPECGKKYRV